MAKRKTLFDDRPVEISELTYIIKHDLASINQQLGQLQSFGKPQRAAPSGKKDKGEEHRGNVVTLLQSRLAGTTSAFQEVLEVRTKVSCFVTDMGVQSVTAEAQITCMWTVEHEGIEREDRPICFQWGYCAATPTGQFE